MNRIGNGVVLDFLKGILRFVCAAGAVLALANVAGAANAEFAESKLDSGGNALNAGDRYFANAQYDGSDVKNAISLSLCLVVKK